MIDTKLILIEGVPGSGKSTTASILFADLSTHGINCNCFLERSENNPISIGNMENLSEIISTTKLREQNVFQQWKDFTKRANQKEIVNIIESRFWQTGAIYLYLSGHSENEVTKSNHRLISVLYELNPVLIYLAPKDIEQMITQICKIRNKEWRESGKEGSWEQWGNEIYEQQKWFTYRSAKGPDAIYEFFNEWASIADKLYEELPFRKIKIQDPQINWSQAIDCIRVFLNINP